jgi:hypothetical protein
MDTNNPLNEQTEETVLDEVYLNGLLVRISKLEKEQKLSRAQIQRLTADKKRIKQRLHELTKERSLINKNKRHEQPDSSSATLLIEIQNKTIEERKLRKQLEKIQYQTEQEIKKLREERDAALTLIEGRQFTPPKLSFFQQYKQLIISVILITFLFLAVSAWLLLI